MMAFGTGLPRDARLFEPFGWPVSTTRYLYPGIVVAAMALGLAAQTPGVRGPGRYRSAARGRGLVLVRGRLLARPPSLPAPGLLAAGAAVGAIALVAAPAAATATTLAVRRRGVAAAAALGSVAALGLGAAAVGRNYTERHARTRASTAIGNRASASAPGGASLLDWFERQPAWLVGDDPIRFASRYPVATLAGDHLRHRVELLPARAPCGELRRRARGGWVVTSDPGYGFGFLGTNSYDGADCFKREGPVYASDEYEVYRVDR